MSDTFPPLTDPLSDSVGVVTPLVVRGQHLLQHQQHTGDQAFVLSAAELTLREERQKRSTVSYMCKLHNGSRS